MANQYVNKLVKDGVTKFDLTSDTVTPETLVEGVTAHDKSGAPIVGTIPASDIDISVCYPDEDADVAYWDVFIMNTSTATFVFGSLWYNSSSTIAIYYPDSFTPKYTTGGGSATALINGSSGKATSANMYPDKNKVLINSGTKSRLLQSFIAKFT